MIGPLDCLTFSRSASGAGLDIGVEEVDCAEGFPLLVGGCEDFALLVVLSGLGGGKGFPLLGSLGELRFPSAGFDAVQGRRI